ncbi:nucleotidyltransferase domain-containing protein [Sulfurovum sp.]|jgi:predicted nucleotidyltransferase|uniref:nucleotidyltransferase family protein n=1 Tax=Sulfurovum sp. TaxID=1969726 RepID=UPI0025DAD3D0|nr:nucleotidyltransferase domain-containing protein [Sulfurovum sp.]
MLSKENILQYLKEYKSLKQDTYSISKIGIFGSYARDEADENSDIDIVVDFKKADLYNQISIMQELEEHFHKHVDVIALWKRMNPKLLSRIQKDAIYV